MFKKLDDLAKPTLLNKSATKDLRATFLESYPSAEPIIDQLIPKKGQLISKKLKNEYKCEIIEYENQILFFVKEDIVYPHLKLLHKYPDIMPKMQIDAGGLKFVLGGANVMCPGLTSAGGKLIEAKKGDPVAIYAEGKEHALAVGRMLMSSNEIKEKNQGHGIETLHHLGDALWALTFK